VRALHGPIFELSGSVADIAAKEWHDATIIIIVVIVVVVVSSSSFECCHHPAMENDTPPCAHWP
jgi:peptidoglycan/LPS O-acetylase OafA/YrhL